LAEAALAGAVCTTQKQHSPPELDVYSPRRPILVPGGPCAAKTDILGEDRSGMAPTFKKVSINSAPAAKITRWTLNDRHLDPTLLSN